MRIFGLLVLVGLLAASATAGEKKTAWCVVQTPESVHAGDDLVVRVAYTNIANPVTVFADLHYNKPNGRWAGKLARGGSFGTVQGAGVVEVRLAVPRKPAGDVDAVLGVIFISPGGWNEQVGLVNGTAAKLLPPRAENYPPIRLADGYTNARPRLLFGVDARTALQEKRLRLPALWEPVLAQARSLGTSVPDSETIRSGVKYWRAEWMLSGALAAWVTDSRTARDDAVAWMTAHALEETWGVGWRENIDLPASWYLYYLSLAYDLLRDDLKPLEHRVVAKGLAGHARAIYEARDLGRIPYDQNHTYIPATALVTAALALAGEVPEAQAWLDYGCDLMRKCRRVLSPDGYYYEGTGYWEYALHWHVRYADLLARATGQDAHNLPFFRHNARYPLHLSLPGPPWVFDLGDAESRPGARTATLALGRKAILYRYADLFGDGLAQALAERIRAQGPASEDPAMTFLWTNPAAKSAPLETAPTYHHFDDFGVIAWRSSWEPDATVCMFKCGPPNGYAAAQKFAELPTWRSNTGHAHPDIGMFWLYARGAYLAGDTGYNSRKKTRDHNTLLVDGKGMGEDGIYWIYSGFPDKDIPYAKWTPARLEKVHLEPAYAYALGDFSTVYPDELGKLTIRRHFAATRDFVLVYDELGGERPHTFTWLLHADNAFAARAANAFETALGTARLTAHVLQPAPAKTSTGPAMVFPKGKPNEGAELPLGHELALETDGAVTAANFLVVLVPAAAAEKPTEVSLVAADAKNVRFILTSAGGKPRAVTLDLAWQPPAGGAAAGKGPMEVE